MTTHVRPALPALGAVALLLSGCVANTPEGSDSITVRSTEDVCEVSPTTAPAGTITFSVTNDGSDITEFYLLREDGQSIVSEVENIGPGITRDLVVQVGAGTYVTACKPGMAGDGIRGTFTVTGESSLSPDAEHGAALDAAAETYLSFVRSELDELSAKTAAFLDAYRAGEDDTARALYADARVHWERVEPVAESFGDLDPSMDAREADLASGDEWTGWHRMEKSLWPPAEGYALTSEERAALADRLAADTAELVSRVSAADFSIDAFQIGNGAKELLDEVASGKITGEEEIWSHTDLYDFQANVEGAEMAFEVLESVVSAKDPELVEELETRFDALTELLATYGSIPEGFVPYTDLTEAQIVELSRAVDALAEPLSRLTAAVVA